MSQHQRMELTFQNSYFILGQCSAADAKSNPARLPCSKVEVIATKLYGHHNQLADHYTLSVSRCYISRLKGKWFC